MKKISAFLQSKIQHLKSGHGFSLVELSVVIGIIGITMSGALDLATRKTEANRVTETNTRLDAIESAMQVYLANNQRLPCPANPAAALSSSLSGNEVTSGNNPSTCGASNILSVGSSPAEVFAGAVPTKTLDLPDKYMADDWDRRFTYVVDRRFTNNKVKNADCDGSSDTNHTICFKQTTAGGITVNDSTGAAITSEAIYVIISHGKNGYGAWTYNGSTTRLSQPTVSDTDEKNNAGSDAGAFDATFVQKDSTTTFDDIVRYSIKATMIANVGGVTDTITCNAAEDTVNGNTTNSLDPCIGLASTPLANCNGWAAKIYNLCLQP